MKTYKLNGVEKTPEVNEEFKFAGDKNLYKAVAGLPCPDCAFYVIGPCIKECLHIHCSPAERPDKSAIGILKIKKKINNAGGKRKQNI